MVFLISVVPIKIMCAFLSSPIRPTRPIIYLGGLIEKLVGLHLRICGFAFRLPSGVCRLLNCVSEAAQICLPSATTDIGPNIYSLSTVLATRYVRSYFEVLRYRF